ncbi:MAG: hypothetical protein AAGH71_04675 [Planctomycetota bacterium]
MLTISGSLVIMSGFTLIWLVAFFLETLGIDTLELVTVNGEVSQFRAALFMMLPPGAIFLAAYLWTCRPQSLQGRLRRGRCWKCDHDLGGQPSLQRGQLFVRCPECGEKSMTKRPRQRPVPFMSLKPTRRVWMVRD